MFKYHNFYLNTKCLQWLFRGKKKVVKYKIFTSTSLWSAFWDKNDSCSMVNENFRILFSGGIDFLEKMCGITVQPAGRQRGTNIAGFSGESMELVGVQNHRGIVSTAIFAYNAAPGSCAGRTMALFSSKWRTRAKGMRGTDARRH